MPSQVYELTDRAAIALARWDARTRKSIRNLLSPEVIAEHEDNPRGHHGDRLEGVLDYFRRSSTLTPRAGPDERVFYSEADPIRAVAFLKRVDEMVPD